MAAGLSLADLMQITTSARACVAYLAAFSELRSYKELRDPGSGLLKTICSELIRHVKIAYPVLRQHSHCFDQLGIDPADVVRVSGQSFGNAHFAALELARSVLGRMWLIVAPNDWEVMVREGTLSERLRTPDFDVELVSDRFDMIRPLVEEHLTGDIASLTARIDGEHAFLRKQIEGRTKRSLPVSPDDPAESVHELLYRCLVCREALDDGQRDWPDPIQQSRFQAIAADMNRLEPGCERPAPLTDSQLEDLGECHQFVGAAIKWCMERDATIESALYSRCPDDAASAESKSDPPSQFWDCSDKPKPPPQCSVEWTDAEGETFKSLADSLIRDDLSRKDDALRRRLGPLTKGDTPVAYLWQNANKRQQWRLFLTRIAYNFLKKGGLTAPPKRSAENAVDSQKRSRPSPQNRSAENAVDA